jgi:hypothetical protein
MVNILQKGLARFRQIHVLPTTAIQLRSAHNSAGRISCETEKCATR